MGFSLSILATTLVLSGYAGPTYAPSIESEVSSLERLELPDHVVRLRYPAQRQYDLLLRIGSDGLRVGGRFIQPIALVSPSEGSLQALGEKLKAPHPLKHAGPKTWLGSFRKGRSILDIVILTLNNTVIATFLDGSNGEALAVATFPAPKGRDSSSWILSGTQPLAAFQRDLCTDKRSLGPGPLLTAVVSEVPRGAITLETTSDGTVIQTSPTGLEHMVCNGVEPTGITAELPWRYVDPTYLHAENRPPSTDLAAHYKNHRHVAEILRRWADAYPSLARFVVLGKSHQGRDIMALAIGNPAAKKRLLFNGAHHADELLTVDAVLDIGQELLTSQDPFIERVRRETLIWLIPLVNPDGSHAFLNHSIRAGRKNGRDLDGDGTRAFDEGVDLNRNYPVDWNAPCSGGCTRNRSTSRNYRGSAPASEPETQAIMKLADTENFRASISYHMGTIGVLLPHSRRRPIDELANLAQDVAKALGRHPSGAPYRARESSQKVRGADQDYHWHRHGTLALLLEMYGWPPPTTPAERRRILDSVRPAWKKVAGLALKEP